MSADITGAGFDHPDGTTVTAAFGRADDPLYETQSTQLDGGAFALSFDSPGGCNLGSTREEPLVFYIDTDGDGACRLESDEVYVWIAAGGPAGNENQLAISPEAPHCHDIYPHLATRSIDAARRLCPEITDCLPFCGRPDPLAPYPESFVAYCADGPDGGVVDGGTAPDGGDAPSVDGGS